jgi:hypothetical protein
VLLRSIGALAAAGLLASSFSQCADAAVDITIDKSSQRMTVEVDGKLQHVWPVSTGRSGFRTPNGKFRPKWLARSWVSRQYDDSPMPHSIFFHEGYAIHGTTYVKRLGGPASHGCVRLAPEHAETLYGLVRQHGRANTAIVISGTEPVPVPVAKPAKQERKKVASSESRRREYRYDDWRSYRKRARYRDYDYPMRAYGYRSYRSYRYY